ncbi:MAG: D-alanyl-D-alanine carboxypeptidase/D-alanyl-D-alanine endopeptidase [Gemmatimonadaceae bacterium]
MRRRERPFKGGLTRVGPLVALSALGFLILGGPTIADDLPRTATIAGIAHAAGPAGPADPAHGPLAAVATTTATPAAAVSAMPGQRPQRVRPSPRREPSVGGDRSPAPAAALETNIGTMLEARVRNGDWGVMVVSLTRGDTLYSRSAGELFAPASTMKLFTAALALDRFGPDYHFSTEVLRDGQLLGGGFVNGHLYLRGGGDPAFSNRFLRGDADIPLELLARFVVDAGITHVQGDVIADASAFEERRIPEGWSARNLGYGYAAPVSALSVNENVMWVTVHPPSAGGGTPRGEIEPSSSVMTLHNAVKTRAGSRGGNIVVRRTGDNELEVRGWIGTRSIPRRYQVVIREPALFTAGAFRDALAEQGITIEGNVRLGRTPANAVRVAALPSPPLARLLSVMNRESVNHYAELIFRNAARGPQKEGIGSAEHAYADLSRFMTTKVGAERGSVYATDGSGLSTLDKVTPRALIQLLAYSHAAPWASTFHASLPVAGESELLRNRMRSTAAQGNLHAKTGTTSSVISLAGYTTALNGEVIAFAFLYNGRDRWRARETIDRMGATLASFVRE